MLYGPVARQVLCLLPRGCFAFCVECTSGIKHYAAALHGNAMAVACGADLGQECTAHLSSAW